MANDEKITHITNKDLEKLLNKNGFEWVLNEFNISRQGLYKRLKKSGAIVKRVYKLIHDSQVRR